MAERKKLRVLVVGLGNSRITFLDRFIQGLAAQGVQFTLAVPQKKTADRFQSKNINWLWAPNWSVPFIKRVLNLIRLWVIHIPSKRKLWLKTALAGKTDNKSSLIEAYRLLPFARGEWDVIYFPWNATAITYKALYALGIPVVVSCRGSQINVRTHTADGGDYTQDLTISLQGASRVHCVSQDILEEAIKYGLDREKAVVIRPAVDPRYFTPSFQPPIHSQLRLITTGSLVWVKGYEYALLAVKQLVDADIDVQFHIIGEGPEKQRILYTIQDLELNERVFLHGKLPPDQVRDQLQQADIFLLSSLSEGISNAVLEAMSCGLPVVTTECGGMRESVTDGVDGFVVPVRNPEAMADAVIKLTQEPVLRDQMGKAGRERILRDFDLNDQVEAFLELFSSVTKDSK